MYLVIYNFFFVFCYRNISLYISAEPNYCADAVGDIATAS